MYVIFKRIWDRSLSSQHNLTKSRHISSINLKNFGNILPWPTCMPRGYLLSSYVQYLLYLLPLPSPKYCTVRTYLGPCQKGILFMPKASFSILRSESVQIKPLQWLPAVCTCHMSYCITPKGGQHIRPTLLPRHMLHLILINFADNFVYLCFFRLKSAFEQIWVKISIGECALNLCLHASELQYWTGV